jgi:SlyX protein
MDEKRMEEMEIRMAYLEDYTISLNEVVLKGNRKIEYLEEQLQTIKRKMEELAENLPAPENQKPPHY